MSFADFKVNLADLLNAKEAIATEVANVHTLVGQIANATQTVAANWASPAGGAFGQLQVKASNDMDGLVTILDEMVTRMQGAYENYRAVEMQNTSNFNPTNH